MTLDEIKATSKLGARAVCGDHAIVWHYYDSSSGRAQSLELFKLTGTGTRYVAGKVTNAAQARNAAVDMVHSLNAFIIALDRASGIVLPREVGDTI